MLARLGEAGALRRQEGCRQESLEDGKQEGGIWGAEMRKDQK